ncbi:MAG: hypothetical protein NTX51_17630 [Verrucomicrobia bacterium]|nr:hypothetical protein [Verrucomicrobiota bacterium]
MKIKDIPQVGKLGLTVTWPGRNGLIRRTLATPRNPRTAAQQVIRQSLATQAAAYDQLTDAQQEAWIAAAAQMQSKPTLGQSGPLTGLQLFTKVNCALLAIGGDPVTTPPAKSPMWPEPSPSGCTPPAPRRTARCCGPVLLSKAGAGAVSATGSWEAWTPR